MDSELADVVGKLHPMYQTGFDTGSNGSEPPMDLNKVTRLKQKKKEDTFAKLLSKDREPFEEILSQLLLKLQDSMDNSLII